MSNSHLTWTRGLTDINHITQECLVMNKWKSYKMDTSWPLWQMKEYNENVQKNK